MTSTTNLLALSLMLLPGACSWPANAPRRPAVPTTAMHGRADLGGGGKATPAVEFQGGDALVRAFTDAYEKDFEIVGHRFVLAEPDWVFPIPSERHPGVWLLMKVRPRHAGRLVFRYEVDSPNGKTVNQEYLVVVAESGTPRLHRWDQYGGTTYPTACLGDELIVPFAVCEEARNGHFLGRARRPENAQHVFESYEQRDVKALLDARTDFAVEMDRDAAAHLKFLSAHAVASVTRELRHDFHSMGTILEARKPGRFNLAIAVAGTRTQKSVPVIVVPEDVPVPVLAPVCWYDEDRSGSSIRHELKTLVLRVGDRVGLSCHTFVTAADADPPYPGATLASHPFVPDAGSFDFVGAPEAVTDLRKAP